MLFFCYQEATIPLNIHKAQAAMNEKATQIFYFHKFFNRIYYVYKKFVTHMKKKIGNSIKTLFLNLTEV